MGISLQKRATPAGWQFFRVLFIYAGAVQFLALSLLETDMTIFSLALGAAALAMRNAFYGIPSPFSSEALSF